MIQLDEKKLRAILAHVVSECTLTAGLPCYRKSPLDGDCRYCALSNEGCLKRLIAALKEGEKS